MECVLRVVCNVLAWWHACVREAATATVMRLDDRHNLGHLEDVVDARHVAVVAHDTYLSPVSIAVESLPPTSSLAGQDRL